MKRISIGIGRGDFGGPEKSHSQPSTRQRRKTGGVIWFKSKGLRTSGASSLILSLKPKAQEQEFRCPSSRIENLPFLHHFVLFSPLLDDVSPRGEGQI